MHVAHYLVLGFFSGPAPAPPPAAATTDHLVPGDEAGDWPRRHPVDLTDDELLDLGVALVVSGILEGSRPWVR